MKKTIAKIMAAAMILSAVPAVAMPTLTAEAAAATAVTVSYVSRAALAVDGFTGYTFGTMDPSNASIEDTIAFTASIPKVVDKTYSGVSASASVKDKKVYVTVTGDGQTIEKMVKAGDNTVQLKAYWKSSKATVNLDTSSSSNAKTDEITSIKATTKDDAEALHTYNFGSGAAEKDSKGQYTEVTDVDGLLAIGDVYATLDSGKAVVKRGAASDLDGNDTLRGQLLDLNVVEIAGVQYEVKQIAAQALKKAHMKKIKAENVTKIGKGALRKAKQLKHADFQDSNKIRKILGKAFYDCKNLKTIIIDGRKLKTVGKDAFHGVKKNCTVKIKAKKSKFESDKKMILKNGGNKNLKFVRK